MGQKLSSMEFYNSIASKYDKIYSDRISVLENIALMEYLNKVRQEGMVLDAGCGTGLILDELVPTILPEEYMGFDISQNMLNQAIQKHPDYRTRFIQHDLLQQRVAWVGAFENVWCLYGVLTCLSEEQILEALVHLYSYLKEGGSMVLVPNGTRDPSKRESTVHSKAEIQANYTLMNLKSWKFLVEGVLGKDADYTIRPFNTVADYTSADDDIVLEGLRHDLDISLNSLHGDVDCSFFVIEIRK